MWMSVTGFVQLALPRVACFSGWYDWLRGLLRQGRECLEEAALNGASMLRFEWGRTEDVWTKVERAR